MRGMKKAGKQVWPSPDVMEFMGAKDALTKIANLNIGLEDTLSYYTEADFKAGFKKTMAFQPRVIKQNRGSAGEGIWICMLEGKDYCKNFGDSVLEDSDKLKLTEANDNHEEYHTVGEFLEFCVNGRNDKSGEWSSVGTGSYLAGGKAAGGQLVDQRFCPRIVEGEVRALTINDTPIQFVHKKPKEGGLSAVGGTGSTYTYFDASDPTYAELNSTFKADMPKVMEALGLVGEPLPLLWTGDFIPVDGPDGTTVYTVGEFNCSCVGISKFQAHCGESLAAVSAEDTAEGMKLCVQVGEAVKSVLDGAAKPVLIGPCDGIESQPESPKYKTCIVEYMIPGVKNGGTDKGTNGHRIDTIPMANGVIAAGMSCQPV
jgi:hypothetical protein